MILMKLGCGHHMQVRNHKGLLRGCNYTLGDLVVLEHRDEVVYLFDKALVFIVGVEKATSFNEVTVHE